MNIWLNGEYVFMRVNNHFVYNFNISKLKELGNINDEPSVLSMWGRINHLREKNWWNNEMERSFITFCENTIK